MQIRIVLAHRVAEASLLILEGTSLAADGARHVPHAVRVTIAHTLRCVPVAALLLACRVRSESLARLGVAKHAQVAGRVGPLVHIDIKILGFAHSQRDTDGKGRASDVVLGIDQRAVGVNDHVKPINACLVLARGACSCRANCRAERVI